MDLNKLPFDPRDIRTGKSIPVQNYCDQPYVVKTDDQAWLLVVTTGNGDEGDKGQHLISMRSHDCGQTWEDVTNVESEYNPESSYGVVYKTRYGRIYCFYNYNADNLRSVRRSNNPEDGSTPRVDTQGHFVFKYSDDHGKSWSKEWYDIPQRKFQVDLDNPYGGNVLFFWNVGKPVELDSSVMVPLYKVGYFAKGSFMAHSEGVLLKCSNIHTQRDPRKLQWETLPDGDVGIRVERSISSISEEHSFVRLSDNSLFCVFRTVSGHPYCAYSRDGGHTFTKPEMMCYADGRPIKHPRAANFIWKCKNGKYLYWFHNHGGKSYDSRNPAWLSGAEEYPAADGLRLRFSYPEKVLYDQDVFTRMSYPDLIEEESTFYLTETQKKQARVHPVDPDLLHSLWGMAATPQDGIALVNGDSMPAIKPFIEADPFISRQLYRSFSFDLTVCCSEENAVLFSTLENGRGIHCTWDSSTQKITLQLSDGRRNCSWDTDANMLHTGQTHRFTAIVDGGPRIISFVIDGVLCDGGTERQYGYGWFDHNLITATGSAQIKIHPSVEQLTYYDRLLFTNEAILLHKK